MVNAFQIVTLAAIAAITGFVVIAIVKHRLSPRVGLAWLALWSTAGAAIAKPELTVIAARAMGIRRGADLVIYVSILAMLVGFFAVYVKLRKLESTITEIVRRIAIDRPMAPDEPLTPPSRGGTDG
jgi:small membrane protein